MDSWLYKHTVTSRGVRYHYYFSPAQPAKPTLLLCHGFPSTSRDWRQLAPRLQAYGYGVLAPDMLGYGATDKPTDPAAYVPSALCRDMVDIVDAEGLGAVVAVGHDWGCIVVARLASHYPERCLAYVFLATPFLPVVPPMEFETFLELQKAEYGQAKCGYWLFFSEPDAHIVIQEHMDSFISLLFPHDPTDWQTRLIEAGALKKNLLEDYAAPRPQYMSEEDLIHFRKTFERNGFAAPTCWYKVMTSQLAAKDDQQIPPERMFPPASAPIFFAAVSKDYICTPEIGRIIFGNDTFRNHSVTTTEYDADHWFILSHADQVARDLESWIESAVSGKARL